MTDHRWQLVEENVAHPYHHGVVGNLMYASESSTYQLWQYLPPPINRYERHAVPYKWAELRVGVSQ